MADDTNYDPRPDFDARPDPRPATPPRRRGSALPWLLVVLLAAALGAGGYYGYGLYDAEKTRSQAAMQQAEEERNRAKELQAKVDALEAAKGSLAAERDELAEDLKEKEAQLQKLLATRDALQEKLQAEIKKGEIRLTQVGERLQVDLVDKILFDSGEAELSKRGKEVLDRVGVILANVEDKLIQVSGHTDDSPIREKLRATYPSNWELSVARAVNVVRHLAEQTKVPARRLVAAGYGEHHPIASNINHEGRARNRRIEILLTPMLDAKKAKLPVAKAAPAPAKTVATKATSRGKVAPASAKKTSSKKKSTAR